MGQVVRTIGQVAVDAVGYAVGGPLGFAVANLAFGLIFPPDSGQVQKFGDTNLEGSELGIFIPQIYGQMGKVRGNVIDCGHDHDGNPAGILVKVKNEKMSAKGGGGASTQKVEVGYLTAAYLIGAGPLYIDKITTQTSDGEVTIFDRHATSEKKRGGGYIPEFAADGTLISEVSDGGHIRLYYGTEYQQPDTALQGVHGDVSAYRGVSYVVFNQYEIKASPNFEFYVRSPLTGRLEIIMSRLLDSEIPSTRINLKNIWGRTNGAWVTSRDNARALCEGLAKECFTDFIFPDGVIRDSSRCFPMVWSMGKIQMGATAQGSEAQAATIEIKGDEEFASDFSIPFNDIDLNYDQNSAHAIRYTNNNQVVTKSMQLPVSANLTDMLAFAKILQDEQWIADRTIKSPLMPENIKICPGDIVVFPNLKFPISTAADSGTEYFITDQDISPEGIVSLTGEPYNALVYYPVLPDSIKAALYPSDSDPTPQRPTIPVYDIEAPLAVVLDAPINDALAITTGILYAACAPLDGGGVQTHWAGSQFTPATTEFPATGLTLESTMGVTTSTYSFDMEETTRINYGKTLNITMSNGSLNTATESDVLEQHANMLAINTGDPANTLLLQFVTATKTGTNTYQITGLLPGLQGTDYVNSIPSGAKVVLLTSNLGNVLNNYATAETDNHYIGNSITYKSYADDDNYTSDETFTFSANSRRPLSPSYMRVAARNVGTDVTLAWCARSRFQAGATWTLTQPSDPDNYIINFKSGSTIVHTLAVTGATQAIVTETDLSSWYGSLPSTITGDIAQVSDLVGAGHQSTFSLDL